MGVWYSSYRILISKGWGGQFCIMVYVCIIIFPIVDTWTVENLCGRFQLYQDTHPYDHIYHRRCGLSLISCRSRLYYFRRCWKDVEKILEIIFYFILWRQCCVCVGTHASCMKGFPKKLVIHGILCITPLPWTWKIQQTEFLRAPRTMLKEETKE